MKICRRLKNCFKLKELKKERFKSHFGGPCLFEASSQTTSHIKFFYVSLFSFYFYFYFSLKNITGEQLVVNLKSRNELLITYYNAVCNNSVVALRKKRFCTADKT